MRHTNPGTGYSIPIIGTHILTVPTKNHQNKRTLKQLMVWINCGVVTLRYITDQGAGGMKASDHVCKNWLEALQLIHSYEGGEDSLKYLLPQNVAKSFHNYESLKNRRRRLK